MAKNTNLGKLIKDFKQRQIRNKAAAARIVTPEQRTSRLASEVALQSTPDSDEWGDPVDPNQPYLPGLDPYTVRTSESETRGELARRMFPVFRGDDNSAEQIATSIYDSTLPTSTFSSLSTPIGAARLKGKTEGTAYSMGTSDNDGYVQLDKGLLKEADPETYYSTDNNYRPSFVATHELGHVAERRATGRVGRWGDRLSYSGSGNASAAGEGYAEGVGLRFYNRSRPPQGPDDPRHKWFGGYSPENWNDDYDKVSFVAHRAEAWSRGVRPYADSIAEAIHTMGQNPHVRDAVKAAGLTDAARNLSNQFMQTKHVGTQLSLLGDEDNQELYSVPDVDWDN